MTFKNNRFAKAAVATGAGLVMMIGGAGAASAQTPSTSSHKLQYTPYEAPYQLFSCRVHPEMVWC